MCFSSSGHKTIRSMSDFSSILNKHRAAALAMKMHTNVLNRRNRFKLNLSETNKNEDDDISVPKKKKRGRKSKAEKEAEAELIASGAITNDSDIPKPKKRKGRPKKVKDLTEIAANVKQKAPAVVEDLDSMFPNLEEDLKELEGKLGDMGDLGDLENFRDEFGISEANRNAIETISDEDLQEALKGFGAGGNDEMDEFINLMESDQGKQATAAARSVENKANDNGVESSDALLDLLAEIEKTDGTITKAEEADGVAVTDTIATSAKTIVSSPTIEEGTEEPTKKRRGRPPSAKTLSKDVAETEAKVVVPTTTTTATATTTTTSSVAKTIATDGKTTTEEGSDSNSQKSGEPLVIDGVELDSKEFDLGVEPPPLEEFKRLMESLGPETLFEEEGLESASEQVMKRGKELSDMSESEVAVMRAELEEELAGPEYEVPLTTTEKGWYPKIYKGGKPVREPSMPVGPGSDKLHTNFGMITTRSKVKETYMKSVDDRSEWRLQIVSVVTNSSKNSTAIDVVNQVYEYIKKATDNDDRIEYQIICYSFADDEPFEELEDNIQMWCESYNTYHLVDGAAMKEVWGAIMPHIMLSEHNLEAIVKQIKWALAEEDMRGAMLTPRLRRLRFRGGAAEMVTGFNTEHLDSEFSVISVR